MSRFVKAQSYQELLQRSKLGDVLTSGFYKLLLKSLFNEDYSASINFLGILVIVPSSVSFTTAS